MSLIATWSGLRPPKLTPWSKRGTWWRSGASAVSFGVHFIKQKLLGTPNKIWKDLGPVSFWSCGHSLSRGVYKKIVVYVPNSAWPWKAIVWLSQHALVIKHNLYYNYLFKTSFKSLHKCLNTHYFLQPKAKDLGIT